MIARYDFATKPWSWDFFPWLVSARTLGATAVDFRLRDAVSTKWDMAESWTRFWNYLYLGPIELADMPVTVEGDGVEIAASHNWADVPRSFERLRLSRPTRSPWEYTVTLRDTFHRPERNSNQEVWREFAAEIGARVIEDSRCQPISLHDRFSLYAGARMNYGVPNGPVSVLLFTKYPVAMFCDLTNVLSVKTWASHGIKPGDRPHWLRPDQHMVWERPTVASLMRWHNRECDHGQAQGRTSGIHGEEAEGGWR